MERICYNCFQHFPEESKSCPYCGYNGREKEDKFRFALRPGSFLANRYVFGRPLRQDGFDVTYVALDRQTKTRVALQEYLPTEFVSRSEDGTILTLNSDTQKDDYELGMNLFLEEARTLAQFAGYEHIINIHSCFEENGTAYFVTEYLEGVDLKRYILENGGPLPVHEANRILLPIMENLQSVHEKGIVHRNIAPDNIIIKKDGNAKLIDFGAARYSAWEKSKSLDVILKHGFAPIEQYSRRGRQGPFTDVYAMAATYYYAITGKVPPDAIYRMDGDTLLTPSALGVQIRSSTEQVLLKALSLKAGERFQNMKEFYRALLQTMTESFSSSAGYAASGKEGQPQTALSEKMPREEYAYSPSPSRRGGVLSSLFGLVTERAERTKTKKNDEKRQPVDSVPTVNNVQFSAVFPKCLVKGKHSILEMYLYEQDYRNVVEEALKQTEKESKEQRSGILEVTDQAKVRILLACTEPDVSIDGNDDIQTWKGKYLKFDFGVYLGTSCPANQVMFTATIYFNDVPATRLRFTADCNSSLQQKMDIIREDILSAFVSYASSDRQRVAAIIQGMKKARPDMDIFIDVDRLRSGVNWEQALRAEIERRDILFLCWSLAARESEWVEREWRYALAAKGIECIEPVPIDPPDKCPPPKELAVKHFSDRELFYFKN